MRRNAPTTSAAVYALPTYASGKAHTPIQFRRSVRCLLSFSVVYCWSNVANYTEAQKAEAVELYVEVGTAEAARRIGVTPRSINNWAKAAGVTSQERVQKTEGAREVLAATQAEKREELRGLLLDAGIHHVTQSIAAESGRDAQAYMVGAGIGIDKYRLEMGEATELVITGDMMDQAIIELRASLGEDPPTR